MHECMRGEEKRERGREKGEEGNRGGGKERRKEGVLFTSIAPAIIT